MRPQGTDWEASDEEEEEEENAENLENADAGARRRRGDKLLVYEALSY
jgi:hypothetical protein